MGRQPLRESAPRPDERLVAIVAEMLRSALAWEQEHGIPLKVAESALTGMPKGIHCVVDRSRKLHVLKGGKGNGFDSYGGQEWPPADDLRGPEGPPG
mgnify:CR=1 FL=1